MRRVPGLDPCAVWLSVQHPDYEALERNFVTRHVYPDPDPDVLVTPVLRTIRNLLAFEEDRSADPDGVGRLALAAVAEIGVHLLDPHAGYEEIYGRAAPELGELWKRAREAIWSQVARTAGTAARRLGRAERAAARRFVQAFSRLLVGDHRGRPRRVVDPVVVRVTYYRALFRLARARTLLRQCRCVPVGSRIKAVATACGLTEHERQLLVTRDADGRLLRPLSEKDAARIVTARLVGVRAHTVANILANSARRHPKNTQ